MPRAVDECFLFLRFGGSGMSVSRVAMHEVCRKRYTIAWDMVLSASAVMAVGLCAAQLLFYVELLFCLHLMHRQQGVPGHIARRSQGVHSDAAQQCSSERLQFAVKNFTVVLAGGF
jgi:hypothetical protein